MKEVYKNIFVGNDLDCTTNGFKVVHACKTCHQKHLGYRGSLNPIHPNYLVSEAPEHLFLNLVDMEREFMVKFTHPIMKAAMDFIGKHADSSKVLIHCNQGASRSCGIALLYLARKGAISKESYQKAEADFIKLYPQANLAMGIKLYLNKNWEDLVLNPIF